MSDLRNKMAKQLRDAQHRGLYGQALSVEAAPGATTCCARSESMNVRKAGKISFLLPDNMPGQLRQALRKLAN